MRVFKNYGAAFLYFLAYFAVQIIVILGFFAYYAVDIMSTGITDYASVTNLIMMRVEKDSILITAASNILYVLLVFLFFLVRKKSFFKETGVRKMSLRTAVASLSVGAALNILVSFIMNYVPFPEKWWDAYIESSSSLSEDVTVLTVFLAVIAAPIAEEILFRGLIFTRMARGSNLYIAAIISSIVFGVMHGTMIWAIYTFVVGAVLVWLFVKTRSLTASILAHFAFNGVSFLFTDINIVMIILSVSITAISVYYILKERKSAS